MQAFAALDPDVIAALTTPASYQLLEAILRSHIAEALLTTEDVHTPGKSVESIEGTPLTFNSANDTVTINKQARLIFTSRTVVGNGVIFKITSLLDPLVGIFGTDLNSTISAPTAPKAFQNPDSIASALASVPDLSIYMDLLNATSPDFLSLLDASLSPGKNLSIFAPSNAAFQTLGMTAQALQPSNQAFSSYLLKYPFIDTTHAGQDMSIVGFPATVRRDGTGAITSVNNAAVTGKGYCVGSACVYTVDKWLDPVFGSF
jgi:uncharacterized surface protein with fasciclin (FAS1) repeats